MSPRCCAAVPGDAPCHPGLELLCRGEYALETELVARQQQAAGDSGERPAGELARGFEPAIALLERAASQTEGSEQQQASMLLCRALFAVGRVASALALARRLVIDDEAAARLRPSPRASRIYAQALVCHAMLLERGDLLPAPAAAFPDDPGLQLSLFRRAGGLYLEQLERDADTAGRATGDGRAAKQPAVTAVGDGDGSGARPTYQRDCQYAIHRSVVLLAGSADGGLADAVDLLRRCLQSPVPPVFRLHALRSARMLLQRSIACGVHVAPLATPRNAQAFVPRSRDEEILLLMLLELEALDPTSSQQSQVALELCDTAWLLLPRHRRPEVLVEICERGVACCSDPRLQLSFAFALVWSVGAQRRCKSISRGCRGERASERYYSN